MTKDVLVTISGLQIMSMAEDSEPVEVITAGDYYKKNNKHYVIYDEVTEGFDGTTKNIIKLQEDCVDITKRGITNVHMVFEQGKKNMTYYTTPYGTIEMGIAATNMNLKEDESGLNMKVDYALDMNDEHVADCYLTVQAQSKDLGDFSFYEN